MPAKPPLEATTTSLFGLGDGGRPIPREPRAVAQRIASIAWKAGAGGVSLLELAAQLPAYSAEEISAAVEQLPPNIEIRDGRLYLVDAG